MENLFKVLGIVFVTVFTALATSLMLCALLPLTALDGWILHLAWGWFVVPTFAVPQIAWAMATGICLLVSWIVLQPSMAREDAGVGKLLVRGVGASLVGWFMMWVVHMWIIH